MILKSLAAGILLIGTGVSSAANLNVELQGMRSQKGKFLYILFDSDEGFPDEPKLGVIQGHISADSSRIQIGGLKSGSYGFSVIHDENGNHKLDKNFLGIPKEGFGFSNNPQVFFGAPGFEKCKFRVDDQTDIQVKVKYL